MNKSKIIENFNKISKSEGIIAAYTFLFKNTDLTRLVRIGISKDIELFKNKEFGNFLIGNNECLVNILSSEIWDEFLFWFVQSREMQTIDFFSMLVQVDFKKFITAIRFTQGFLSENVYSVLEKLDFSNEFSEHENIWRQLRNDDIESWSKIKSDSNTWSDISAEDFFGNLINWLEIERFADDSKERLDMLSRAYNFIISLYLSENYEASKSVTHDKLDKSFWRSFEKLNISLTDTFSSILEYVWFQEAVIIPYSYDLNIEPILKNDTLDFSFQSEEVFSDWKKDGLRYNLNQIRYNKLGMKISSYLIHEKGVEIPKGKTDQDQENNLLLFINSRTTDALLSDLHLDEMKIKGKVYNTHSIVQPILAYSYNRKLRYEDELRQLRPVSNSWQWSYYQLNELSRKKDVDCYPFFLMSKEEYIMHNVQANHSEQKNVYQELIDLFGYSITERFKFNRHRLGYNVWQTPFVRLGEMIFCPMMFFATNEWFYSIAQIVIKNYDRNVELRKQSSLDMEKDLLERFKGVNPKWKCSIPDFKHDGDIDLIISDSNSDLLIQLKRTYFRTGLKDAYFETVRSDRKAISQLIQGEKYILDNKLYPLKKNKFKWLVSTSFENVNQVFEECRKVNYLDLIWILKNKQLDTIEELIEYVKNDKILDEIPLK